MAKRSLQASQEGARLARKVFDRKGWTQENLAAELELKTRQPIWRFFTCRPVERHIFVELCHILDLNWWEIVEHPPEFLMDMVKEQQDLSCLSPEAKAEPSEQMLVDQMRTDCRGWIENQCSVLRVLDTHSPIDFEAFYVPVDLVLVQSPPLREVSASRIKPETELPVRGLGSAGELGNLTQDSRIPAIQGVQQHRKLRVLGKPGSGKTSLLQYLALQCIRGTHWANKVPLIIRLDSFAAYAKRVGKCNLLDFICYELSGCGIDDSEAITLLLREGKFLLLFDALDELLEPESFAIYKEFTRFSERYYKSWFVITARPASDRFEFAQFTDAKIGELTNDQLDALSDNWFRAFSKTVETAQSNSTQLLRQLQFSENTSILELARLPLLFNVIAQQFHQSRELATCHLAIYETCLNLLFERWDNSRGIQHSSVEADVSVAVKEAILSHLAAIGFQQHRFQFERRIILCQIEKKLRQITPDAVTPIEAQIRGRAILAALEHQGLVVQTAQDIYSFSSSGFQMYFTARWIASSPNSNSALAALAYHAADPQLQEIVLLSYQLSIDNEQVAAPVEQVLDQLAAEHLSLKTVPEFSKLP